MIARMRASEHPDTKGVMMTFRPGEGAMVGDMGRLSVLSVAGGDAAMSFDGLGDTRAMAIRNGRMCIRFGRISEVEVAEVGAARVSLYFRVPTRVPIVRVKELRAAS